MHVRLWLPAERVQAAARYNRRVAAMRSAKPAYCTWPSPRASHSAGLFSSVAEPPTCRVTHSNTFTGVALPDTGRSTRSPDRYSLPEEKVCSAVLKNRSTRGVQNELLLNDDAVLACL